MRSSSFKKRFSRISNIKSKFDNLLIRKKDSSCSLQEFKKQATIFVSKLDVKDPNFKYFYLEFFNLCKKFVDFDTNRLLISSLQKYANTQVNFLDDSDDDD